MSVFDESTGRRWPDGKPDVHRIDLDVNPWGMAVARKRARKNLAGWARSRADWWAYLVERNRRKIREAQQHAATPPAR